MINWLDERANRKNEPDLAALFDALEGRSQEDRLREAFECTFVHGSGPCQPAVFLEEGPSVHTGGSAAPEEAFAEQGVSRAWVLQITEQAFVVGYNFAVLAVELEITERSNVRHKELLVWHRDVFSDASDAYSRGLDPNDRNADLFGGATCRAKWGMCKHGVVDHDEERVSVLVAKGQPWMLSINIPSLYAPTTK